MIDTDKYEGHTPGPWHEIFMQGDEYNNGYDDLQTLGFNGTAQDLIADAPDLLAEVRRLREKNRSLFLQLSKVQIQLNAISNQLKENMQELEVKKND